MDFNEQVLKMIGRSRAGAGAETSEPRLETRTWYMDNNGVIVSKPLVKADKEICNQMSLGNSNSNTEGKAASVAGINKVKVMADFIATH